MVTRVNTLFTFESTNWHACRECGALLAEEGKEEAQENDAQIHYFLSYFSFSSLALASNLHPLRRVCRGRCVTRRGRILLLLSLSLSHHARNTLAVAKLATNAEKKERAIACESEEVTHSLTLALFLSLYPSLSMCVAFFRYEWSFQSHTHSPWEGVKFTDVVQEWDDIHCYHLARFVESITAAIPLSICLTVIYIGALCPLVRLTLRRLVQLTRVRKSKDKLAEDNEKQFIFRWWKYWSEISCG